VGSLSGLLITVRTARQGTEMVCGKSTPKYLEEISTVRLNPEDLAELGLAPNQSALLASAHGEAIVTCRSTEGPRGLFFMPLGPVANQLFSAACTYGTGVPEWKSLQVTLSRYEGQCGHQAKNRGESDEHSS
jgi:formylmethanofuran dehydrogenase subunit D